MVRQRKWHEGEKKYTVREGDQGKVMSSRATIQISNTLGTYNINMSNLLVLRHFLNYNSIHVSKFPLINLISL